MCPPSMARGKRTLTRARARILVLAAAEYEKRVVATAVFESSASTEQLLAPYNLGKWFSEVRGHRESRRARMPRNEEPTMGTSGTATAFAGPDAECGRDRDAAGAGFAVRHMHLIWSVRERGAPPRPDRTPKPTSHPAHEPSCPHVARSPR